MYHILHPEEPMPSAARLQRRIQQIYQPRTEADSAMTMAKTTQGCMRKTSICTTAGKVLLLWESPHGSTVSKKQTGDQIPRKSTKHNHKG